MAALSIQVPYPVFYDRDGQPLDNGNIYIGAANLDPLTNPLQVYYDEALTITASQPLKTSNGYIYRNGTPAQLYVDAANFSILVNDSKNLLVYSFPDGTGISPNANGIVYDPPFAGGVPTTVEDKLSQLVSPIDFGAVGDGVTDDRAALEAALESGFPVDGGGYTYGIDGSCSPSSIVGFQNATLVQIGDRSASNASTLYLFGLSDFFIKDLNINMGSGVTTLFNDDGNNGLHILGTNTSTFSENFSVENVSVTGNGCGTGIHIRNAKLFTVDNCVVYDRVSGSSPDPSNDSQNGIQLNNCAGFTLSNSQTKNLKTRLSGTPTLKWTRGFLFVECRNCSIIGCNTDEVDQGFDFSGAYDAGAGFIGNREWTLSGCTANNCATIGFKFANVARDGLVTGCIASNIGNFGFGFSGSNNVLPVGAEKYNTQNIDVVGCKVVNMTGAGWATSAAEAFRLAEAGASPTYPRAIRFKGCHVADTQAVSTTAKAFVSDVAVIEDPNLGSLDNIANTMSDCTADSTVTEFIASPNNIGPNICQVTGSSTQSISSSSWTEINWDVDLIDPCGFHSTTSNSNMIFVKTPGWYRLSVLANFAASATGSRRVRFIKQGGTVDRSTAIAPGSSGVETVLLSSVMTYVESGQNLRVEVFQDSGGPLTFNTNDSHFAIELVSA